MGGSGLPMVKLASHVSVPEWIVNLRHEASHGVSLPSLEILRLAAAFIKSWLRVSISFCVRVEMDTLKYLLATNTNRLIGYLLFPCYRQTTGFHPSPEMKQIFCPARLFLWMDTRISSILLFVR